MCKKQVSLFKWGYMINDNEKETHRYDMSKNRPKHGPKYTKHQICLSTMMVYMHYVTPEQYFKCPFMRKLKQHWG